MEIATSILSVEEENCMQTFHKLDVAHTDYFHIDVMDGKFVENDTSIIMKQYTEHLNQITTLPLDIHLMVEYVESYVKSYLVFNPNNITFHIEATKTKEKTMEMIKLIKDNGSKVGISICPDTKIEDIYEYLPYIHTVLVMSVKPGKGGQKLLPETIEKCKNLSEYLRQNNIEVDIEIDGGVNNQNIKQIRKAGVDIAVVGSYLISKDDYKGAIKELKQQ